MKYKAIIFDMDGTIINTDHIWNHATMSVIKKRGVTLTTAQEQELLTKLAGLALHQSCKVIKEIANLEDSVEHLIQEKHQTACTLFKQHVTFIDGFVEFHRKTQIYNLKVGLATNANNEIVRLTDEQLDLKKLFGSHMYNVSHVGNKGKPDPALYLHTAKQLDVAPHECIAIEDSAHGIAAAKAAGLFCIGINTSKKPEQIQASDKKINHYNDINLEELLTIKNV